MQPYSKGSKAFQEAMVPVSPPGRRVRLSWLVPGVRGQVAGY